MQFEHELLGRAGRRETPQSEEVNLQTTYKETFIALLDHYNKAAYRFEFKTTAGRNNALKVLERHGYDCDLTEYPKGYLVRLGMTSKYKPKLKNSIAYVKTANDRVILMKDLAAIEEAQRFGSEPFQGEIQF